MPQIDLEFSPGDRVRLTAAKDGNANDVSWRWVPPAGSSAPASTSNVLEWTTGANDAGVYDVEVTSPTASDSPGYGVMLLKKARVMVDPDAIDLFAAWEAIDGSLEPEVGIALDDFCLTIKEEPGLWDSILMLCPMAGPITLDAAGQYLRKEIDLTNAIFENMTSAGYSRTHGLQFPGSTSGRRAQLTSNGALGNVTTLRMGFLGTNATGMGSFRTVMGQDEWPSGQRTFINFNESTDLGVAMRASTVPTAVSLPWAAATIEPNFYLVSRPDSTTIRGTTKDYSIDGIFAEQAITIQQPFMLHADSMPPGNLTQMMIMIGNYTTSAHDTVLINAALQYHADLAAALPGK